MTEKFWKNQRFAMRDDAVERLAAVFFDWKEFRKTSGDLNAKQVVERRKDGIAIIHIDGALAFRNDIETYFMDQDTYQSIGDAFDDCVKDDEVKGIVLEIDSPGGVTSGVSDLAQKIYNSRGAKPYGVIAHSAGDMCSAAYWIASACEKIYASNTAVVGSIGTLCVFRKSSEDKISIIRSNLSPNKAPSPDSTEGRSQIEKELDAISSVFISTVAKNRNVSYETVMNDYGKGACFVGSEAVKAGLVDAVLSLEETFENMKQNQTGGYMPNPTNKSAEADIEALKKTAMEEERARIKGINAVFAGIPDMEKHAQSFIDDGKTVAEAKDFAFDQLRAAFENANKEIAGLKVAKPVNNEQKKAQELLDKANEASKKVEGSASEQSDEVVAADINAALKAAAALKGVK
jgi:ClpP class serine protease